MKLKRITADALAAEWAGAVWSRDALLDRARKALDRAPAWLALVVNDLLAVWPIEAPPQRVLAAAIRRHPRAFPADEIAPRVVRPSPLAARGASLGTHLELAALLGVHVRLLDAFALTRPREANTLFHHYDHRWVPKTSGGHRLLEAPRRRLKRLQRAVLRGVVADLWIDEAAHGFVSGRSPVTFAAPHAGRAVVVRVDLADFFTNVTARRVKAAFLRVGIAERVAAQLVRLTTVRTPDSILAKCPPPRDASLVQARWRSLAALREPHLAQGAPTSPGLANVVAARLDRRVQGLAASFGAVYTRYADDLAFSGDAPFGSALGAFFTALDHVVRDEGFRLRAEKTRVLRAHGRQRICGIVVNEGVGLARADRKALEAILFNATRTSVEAQNRAQHPRFFEHLQGRVAHASFVDPAGARRIRELWAVIFAQEASARGVADPGSIE